MLKTKGKTFDVFESIVGKVTRFPDNKDADILLVDNISNLYGISNFKAIITLQNLEEGIEFPICHSATSLDHLGENDIVNINTDGVVNTIYRTNSLHNFLLFTERCNSNCLMCSQPPKDRDDTRYFYDLYTRVIPLIPKDCIELGITGGEPTLLGERYFQLLELLKIELPDTEIHCLTNGRSFAWNNLCERLKEIEYDRLMIAIPLYSDIAQLHDYIVQANDAFNQTIKGIYNLASIGQRIEIRIVLHKQTIPRLVKLSRFIYKNLPFVDHVAFMGLEQEGYTTFNIDKLWIDPVDYQNELFEAVTYLSDFGMNVSIYNAQLCTLPENLWKYSRKSISDWKNIYLDECKNCDALQQCGGMFASALKKRSNYITSLKLEN